MNRKKIPIPALACLVLANLANVLILACRDAIIISSGIKFYDAARAAAIALVVASTVWMAAATWLKLRAFEKEMRAEHQDRIDDMRAPADKGFSEDERRAMYRELADFAAKKWSGMDGMNAILSQLDSMDEYQSEMGRLLGQSGYLKDKPAEIVQQVEDCMYRNIQKLLNYMRIIQTRDRATMSAKIGDCAGKNADLLDKTDDFIVAVVAYVNGDLAPDEEKKTRASIDQYMYVVLQAIDLPETRLE